MAASGTRGQKEGKVVWVAAAEGSRAGRFMRLKKVRVLEAV